MPRLRPEQRKEARCRLLAGESVAEIAREYGITYPAAWQLRKNTPNPVPGPFPNRWRIPDEKRMQILADHYMGGRHPRDIAREQGVSTGAVWLILDKKSGSRRRFAPGTLAEIVRMWHEGRTHQEIQDALDVTPGTIYRTLKKSGLTGTNQSPVRNRGPRRRGLIERTP